MKFPAHKCGLYLTHNEHRDVYTKLADELAEKDGIATPSFETDDAKARAIATDECWTLQWYPETPIGFHMVAGPTLDECLSYALAVEAEYLDDGTPRCERDRVALELDIRRSAEKAGNH